MVIVGAGIVGLAAALRLLERHPSLRLAVLDKETEVGRHQSSRNSGVLHRGVYYAPGSLKARLCVSGAAELQAYCAARGLEVREVGKVIVALDESERAALRELHRRGTANGVPDLEIIGPDRLRELEPHAAGVEALHSPHTAVVDFAAVTRAYASDVVERGGELLLGQRVEAIHERGDVVTVETPSTSIEAAHIVVCAGLQSDRLASLADRGAARDVKIVPFRGDYFVLRPERRDLVHGLIYPVPDPRFPFLGVHFTIRHDGEVWAGPNAVLAFAREGYRRRDVSVRDLGEVLTYPGFLRVAARHWRMGAGEMWRDFVKGAFVRALQRHVPDVRGEDLLPGPSGVRAQAVSRDGTLVDDFLVTRSRRTIHIRNAPSPAATSSLAIGALIADRAESELGVGA
jgi:L-2-hydroxyglutarate oxidase LhgO